MTHSTIAIGFGLGLGLACAAHADRPVFLYSLQDDAQYTQGCFHNPGERFQCKCPIALASSFTGTFGLSVAPSGDPLFDVFDIVNVEWIASLSSDIEITGFGLYEIGADQAGEPVQRMTLELFFDGAGPVLVDSGLVEGGDQDFPPAITIPVGDGFFCPGRRMTIDAGPAANPADVAPPGGDGVVGVLDFLAVLTDWGLEGDLPTDIDNSGRVDTNDLLAVLANWTL
jgi:hypothetical protein